MLAVQSPLLLYYFLAPLLALYYYYYYFYYYCCCYYCVLLSTATATYCSLQLQMIIRVQTIAFEASPAAVTSHQQQLHHTSSSYITPAAFTVLPAAVNSCSGSIASCSCSITNCITEEDPNSWWRRPLWRSAGASSQKLTFFLQLHTDDAVLRLQEAFFSSCIKEGTEISRICI